MQSNNNNASIEVNQHGLFGINERIDQIFSRFQLNRNGVNQRHTLTGNTTVRNPLLKPARVSRYKCDENQEEAFAIEQVKVVDNEEILENLPHPLDTHDDLDIFDCSIEFF